MKNFIVKFLDGNKEYSWFIIAENEEKAKQSVINQNDHNIKILSISKWNIEELKNE